MKQVSIQVGKKHIAAWIYDLIKPHQSISDTEEQHRSRLLAALLLTLFIVGTLIVIISGMKSDNILAETDLVVSTIGLVISAGLYWVTRQGHINLGAIGIISLAFMIFVFAPFAPGSAASFIAYAIIPIVFTGIFFSMKWVICVSILVVITTISLNQIESLHNNTITQLSYFLILASAVFVTYGWHLNVIETIRREELESKNEQLRQSEASLERRVASRTRDLYLAADVSRQVSRVLDLNELLPYVVNTTRHGFDLYHVSVFVYNEDKEQLVLSAGSGDAGERMLKMNKRFHLQGKGLVPKAARDRHASVINDITRSADHFKNPILPDTKSEVALPMIVADQLIGVLDLQADTINRFLTEDLHVLQTLADQIGISMRNAQLFTDAQTAREEAQQSDKVKSMFLASMSHELRTPLNSIINFTKFVARGTMGTINDMQVETLTNVITSGEHLLALINDVLDISKIESGSLNLFIEDEVDLHEIIDNAVSTARSLLKDKTVELIVEIDPNLTPSSCDRLRISQVLLNIMSNACKFTKEGSITLSVEELSDKILFSVRDTGPGITEQDYESVFEKFKQTREGLRQGSGTGLGMPISRSLVEAHGGQMWIESVVGTGSTFYFSLPKQLKQIHLSS